MTTTDTMTTTDVSLLTPLPGVSPLEAAESEYMRCIEWAEQARRDLAERVEELMCVDGLTRHQATLLAEGEVLEADQAVQDAWAAVMDAEGALCAAHPELREVI